MVTVTASMDAVQIWLITDIIHINCPQRHSCHPALYRYQLKHHMQMQLLPSSLPLPIWHSYDIAAHALRSNRHHHVVSSCVSQAPGFAESRLPSLNHLPASCCPFPTRGQTYDFQNTAIMTGVPSQFTQRRNPDGLAWWAWCLYDQSKAESDDHPFWEHKTDRDTLPPAREYSQARPAKHSFHHVVC